MFRRVVVVFLSLFLGSGLCMLYVQKNELYTNSFSTCTKMNLNENIEKVFLVAKKHEVIKKEHFEKMPNLKYVLLKDAANGIAKDAFDGLNLTGFECTGCEFKEVGENFFNTPTLESFHLSTCNIKDIKPGAFKNLPAVTQAWIDRNSIKTIHKGVFTGTNFYMVYLQYNQIEHIEDGAFEDMKRLGYLDLTFNLLTTFDASKTIGPSYTLDVLQLGYNKLQEVKKEDFSTLYALEYLNLTTNSLTKLKCCSFLENKNLTSVDLSHNRLKYIKPDLFCEDNNITHLFLHDNYISYLDDVLLDKIPKLAKITTAGNLWYCSCKNNFEKAFDGRSIKNICHDEDAKCVGEKKCEFGHEEEAYDMSKTKGGQCYSIFWRDVLFKHI